MKLQLKKSSLRVCLGAALIGLAGSNTPTYAQEDAKDTVMDRSSEEAMELRRQAFERKQLERVEPDEQPTVTGEVPDDLLEKIYADLEKRTGGSQPEFELLRAEAVQWNDGGLGCGEPGMNYQQVIVDGYWVVTSYQDEEYDYRATDRGYFKLCAGPALTR